MPEALREAAKSSLFSGPATRRGRGAGVKALPLRKENSRKKIVKMWPLSLRGGGVV